MNTRCFVAAKLHGIVATDKSVAYHGSVSIGRDLMRASGILDHEQVHVINLTNGKRWVTYALPTDPGAFTLNGGGARLGEVGDTFVVLTYRWSARMEKARVVFCSSGYDREKRIINRIRERLTYG